MAICRLCSNLACRNLIAFFIRLEWRSPIDSTVFRCKRVHLGAHEAALLANLPLRDRTKLLLSGAKKFLVRKASGNSGWIDTDTRSFLHLERCYRKISRLDQHRHLLYCGGSFLYLRNAPIRQRKVTLLPSENRPRDPLRNRRSFHSLHLPHTRNQYLHGSADRHLRHIRRATSTRSYLPVPSFVCVKQ